MAISAMFRFPLGDDAALVPRTTALTDDYHTVLIANRDRFARWERWATEEQTLASTRAFLEASERGWLDGSQLPVVIVVPDQTDGERWRIVGSAGLRINRYAASAEVGYWIDGDHEGRGLVTRAVSALLDQAFGPLGLYRVALRCDVDNSRSRAVARRLGFSEEGVERGGNHLGDEHRDDVIHSLLAPEWPGRRG